MLVPGSFYLPRLRGGVGRFTPLMEVRASPRPFPITPKEIGGETRSVKSASVTLYWPPIPHLCSRSAAHLNQATAPITPTPRASRESRNILYVSRAPGYCGHTFGQSARRR